MVDSSEVVCRFLGQRRALVILDNCQHVIDAAAALVDRLLVAAPRVRLLATSREPLGVVAKPALHRRGLLGDDRGTPSRIRSKNLLETLYSGK
jgi:predicted ATPase